MAPCAGEMIAAEDGTPDRPPFDPDSDDRRSGNRVVILRGAHSVHLAHLGQGSLGVRAGVHVVAGQRIGRVGNSGNTMLPHLHINAARGRHVFERGRDAAVAAPLLIEGRMLIKGDRLTSH